LIVNWWNVRIGTVLGPSRCYGSKLGQDLDKILRILKQI
jgi:hypothetical protein